MPIPLRTQVFLAITLSFLVFAQEAPPAVSVEVVTLSAEDITLHAEYPGRVVAHEIAEIRPQVRGIITERLFVEGSLVEAGQQLYQIDPAPYKAAHTRAVAQVQRAEALIEPLASKAERFSSLIDIEAVSRQEYDDIRAELARARADLAIAEAAVETAAIDLDYTAVYAPISGRIGTSLVTKGALVNIAQSEPMAVITALDPVFVDLTIPSTDLFSLERRYPDLTEIAVSLLVGEGEQVYEHEGQLLFHVPAVDPGTGSVKVRARFANPEEALLPGMFARGRLHLAYPDAITVPQRAAVRLPDGKLSVWLAGDDGTARQVRIEADRTVGHRWLVREGLQPGDVLITTGLINLRPGVSVQTRPAARNADDEGGA